MDKAAEYVKQCEKAVEVQGAWEPAEADFMWNRATEQVDTVRVLRQEPPNYNHHTERFTWLPRQDQLQEMVSERTSWVLAKDFAAQVYHLSGDTAMSMEQLWLAFVMHEKYAKTWNGGGWVAH